MHQNSSSKAHKNKHNILQILTTPTVSINLRLGQITYKYRHFDSFLNPGGLIVGEGDNLSPALNRVNWSAKFPGVGGYTSDMCQSYLQRMLLEELTLVAGSSVNSFQTRGGQIMPTTQYC